MGVLTGQLVEVAHILLPRASAPEQAGVFAGDNPASYNANDPIRLWVIQVIVIMAMTQFLHFFLSRIRQPRVIAEVIGGVLLGPTVMGRIPNFTNRIFPPASLTMLNLTSTIGLVLFLFLVGLELDVRVVKRNMKASMAISACGLVLPLGLGAALGVPLYHQFIDQSVNLGHFLLFTAVAVGITAFPVLCRILTELKLLEDTVGVVVLAAGVGNDVVGWILLALTVALVNAASGLTALWVLLTAVGYIIFLLVPVRWAFRWAARRTGSLESGNPSSIMMTLTLVLVFISAFFTDIIGIHAIFGGFLAGLIIPHDNGFAISLVEKLEDLVSLLFLPLYFAYSGLRTNLGLLDDGVTWGYTILICVVAFLSKFIGCSVVAKLSGFSLREAGAIGSLMSCKGLVELIVLNVGLSAGILDTRTFSMFVLHALVLTFITTPLTLAFYPAKYRTRSQALRGQGSKSSGALDNGGPQGPISQETFRTKFAVIVDKVEQLPALMTFTQLLQSPTSTAPRAVGAKSITTTTSIDEKDSQSTPPGLPYQSGSSAPVTLDTLRLIELSERTSAVLKSQAAESLVHSDPILSVLRTFGYLHRHAVSTALAVIGMEQFPEYVTTYAQDVDSQMILLPWSSTASIEDVTPGESPNSTPTSVLDGLFPQVRPRSQNASVVQTQFLRKTFALATTDVALYIDRGLPITTNTLSSHHIFLPFFGGPDDRLALSFVVQLCMNPAVSATVVRFTKVDDALSPVSTIAEAKQDIAGAAGSTAFPDTVYAMRDTQTRMASDSADNLMWDRYTTSSSAPELASALQRVVFSHASSATPLHSVIDSAKSTISVHAQSRALVVVGRSRRMAVENHSVELQQLLTEHNATLGSEIIKTLGDLGAAFVAANTNSSLLVLQSAGPRSS